MPRMENHQALLVVDMQNDFMPQGALAVADGDAIIPVINQLLPCFTTRVLTRDWHPRDHLSFSTTPGHIPQPWPPHCVQHTPGAEFHRDLKTEFADKIVSKGNQADIEGYSAFQATDLDAWLKLRGIRDLFISGVATDYCVLASALDARRLGYRVSVIQDAVRAVNQPLGSGAEAVRRMTQAGIIWVESQALPCR